MLDLQLHTTDSDGTWAWDKVLEHCVQMGLTAFAITDHDTVVRRDEVEAWGKTRNVQAIPGVELSTQENGETVHLLGYFLDGPLDKLKQKLEYLKEGRQNRNKKIIKKLQDLGVSISEEKVQKIAGNGTQGRPHIARALMEGGAVKTIKQAFDRYLGLTGSAYFPKEELPLKEGIELLHEAGAVTSVAHPLLLKRESNEFESSFKRWKDWGLDGLESFYPTYPKEQSIFIQRVASKLGLLMTGGSDFHGENKPHIKIGVGVGDLHVPDELLGPLEERRKAILKT